MSNKVFISTLALLMTLGTSFAFEPLPEIYDEMLELIDSYEVDETEVFGDFPTEEIEVAVEEEILAADSCTIKPESILKNHSHWDRIVCNNKKALYVSGFSAKCDDGKTSYQFVGGVYFAPEDCNGNEFSRIRNEVITDNLCGLCGPTDGPYTISIETTPNTTVKAGDEDPEKVDPEKQGPIGTYIKDRGMVTF